MILVTDDLATVSVALLDLPTRFDPETVTLSVLFCPSAPDTVRMPLEKLTPDSNRRSSSASIGRRGALVDALTGAPLRVNSWMNLRPVRIAKSAAWQMHAARDAPTTAFRVISHSLRFLKT